jgi:hypothetical protein
LIPTKITKDKSSFLKPSPLLIKEFAFVSLKTTSFSDLSSDIFIFRLVIRYLFLTPSVRQPAIGSQFHHLHKDSLVCISLTYWNVYFRFNIHVFFLFFLPCLFFFFLFSFKNSQLANWIASSSWAIIN